VAESGHMLRRAANDSLLCTRCALISIPSLNDIRP